MLTYEIFYQTHSLGILYAVELHELRDRKSTERFVVNKINPQDALAIYFSKSDEAIIDGILTAKPTDKTGLRLVSPAAVITEIFSRGSHPPHEQIVFTPARARLGLPLRTAGCRVA